MRIDVLCKREVKDGGTITRVAMKLEKLESRRAGELESWRVGELESWRELELESW
jgi:hypothetical protein